MMPTLSCRILIKNRLGLHARAAIKLVEMAQSFQATITLTNEDETQATADGVMGLLMLDSSQGQYVTVSAKGSDAEQALHSICTLIEAGFDEDE